MCQMDFVSAIVLSEWLLESVLEQHQMSKRDVKVVELLVESV